jgi:hypothetical protein
MRSARIEATRKALKTTKLFECCYVHAGKGTATYAVHDEERGSFNDPLFYRTVDALTGEVLDEGTTLNSSCVFMGSLLQALQEHYSPEHIKRDGIVLAFECARDAHLYRPESMHRHIVFGQSVFYADVDELHVTDENGLEATI